MATEFESDPGFESSLLDRAMEAGERWRLRAAVRERRQVALADDRPMDADSPQRLTLRVNRLLDDIRQVVRGRRMTASARLRALVERPLPIAVGELSNAMVLEVVNGARDFLAIDFLERGVQAARSVGRILVRQGGRSVARGTGFLVAPGMVMTNHHVLPTEDMAQACGIEMEFEHSRFGAPRQPAFFAFEPQRFFVNDKPLDYALVATAPQGDRGRAIADYGWLQLIATQGKIAIAGNDFLNIIQHPLGREKEVVLRENRVLDLRTGPTHGTDEPGNDAMGPFIHYEADTEKGSSGSPVFNDQWEVIALHHAGVPRRDAAGEMLAKDGTVWRAGQRPLAELDWVGNEGVRVSSLVEALGAATVPPKWAPLLASVREAALPPSWPPADAAQGQAHGAIVVNAAGGATGAGTVTVQLPLSITIAVGAASTARGSGTRPAPQADPGTSALTEEALDASAFAACAGYDRDFLGPAIPLPTLKPRPSFGGLLRVARPSHPADAHELRYHHFSVLMCTGRRLAYVSACNIDFAATATATAKQGDRAWTNDPRIGDAEQLGNRYYRNQGFDRGHMTRRDDVAWGSSLRAAVAASRFSFFYANAAPQHGDFNKSNRGEDDDWGDLENFIATQAGQQRARLSVFNGPIFAANDPPLLDALIPRRFYKIVVWRDGTAAPGAAGFVLDQSDLLADPAAEAIDPGRFRVHQVRIAAIEALVDLDFGVLKDFDVLGRVDVNEAMDDTGTHELRRPSDVRL
jgi:endonuclease G